MTSLGGARSATFGVAGLVCRVECEYDKPLLWVSELHPGFALTQDPDLVVTVRYDDGYWASDLPWIAPDQLLDVPVYEALGGAAVIRSAYYQADVDRACGRAFVRLAGGFNVDGVLRALYAALLPARGACLVRALLRPVGNAAVLVCGDRHEDVVALIDRGGCVMAEPTPFHGGTTPKRPRRRSLEAIELGVDHGTSRLEAAARILERVVVVDHASQTVERVLDIVTRLTASVPVVAGVGAARDASALR